MQIIQLKTKKDYFILTASVLAFIFCLLYSFRQMYGYDIGFYVRIGEWILDNLKVPSRDYFAYTYTGEYIDNYWLYQVIQALIYRIGGIFGLVFINSLLIAVNFILIIYRGVRGTRIPNHYLFPLGLMMVIIVFSISFEIRPHAFSFLILNFLLLNLDSYFKNRTKKNLYYLPVLMLLWVNLHGLLYAMGWVVIGCYWIAIWIKDKKIDKQLSIFFAYAIVICLLNPNFHIGIYQAFENVRMLIFGNPFKENVSELISVFSPLVLDDIMIYGKFVPYQAGPMAYLYMILLLAAWIVTWKRRNYAELLMSVMFFLLLVSALKNVGYFIITTFPVVFSLLDGQNKEAKHFATANRKKLYNYFVWGIIAFSILFNLSNILRTVTNDLYLTHDSSNLSFGWRENSLVIPSKSVDFMHKNKLYGKLINHYNFGGYLEMTLPQPVFIDGRADVMGEGFFKEYLRIVTPKGKKLIEEKYNPQIAIFPYRDDKLWFNVFRNDPSWRLVHLDECACIYLKKGYRDDIPDLKPYIVTGGVPHYTTQNIKELLTASHADNFFERHFKKQYVPMAEEKLATFCFQNEWYEEAVSFAMNGIKKSTKDYSLLYYNTGTFFNAIADYENSKNSYQRFLDINKMPDEKQKNEAEKLINNISKANLNSPEMYYSLGLNFEKQKSFGRALFCYKKALALSNNSKYLLNIAIIYYKKDNLEESQKIFRQLIAEKPEDPYINFNYGLVFYKLKQFETADKLFMKTFSLKNDNQSINNTIIRFYVATNQKEKLSSFIHTLQSSNLPFERSLLLKNSQL